MQCIRRFQPLFLLALASLVGCSALDNCPTSKPPKTIETGSTDSETRTYASAPWDGPLDEFPAKSQLTFVHELGSAPELVISWVSFSSEGTDLTENAGNQGRIDCVDSRVIKISNDTCEPNFFIRVVATATGTASTRETCD